MKAINVVVITLSLAMSSLALAEGGGDRTYERMEKRVAALENRKPVSERQEDVAQEKPTAKEQTHHC
jgi:hypothetical protein